MYRQTHLSILSASYYFQTFCVTQRLTCMSFQLLKNKLGYQPKYLTSKQNCGSPWSTFQQFLAIGWFPLSVHLDQSFFMHVTFAPLWGRGDRGWGGKGTPRRIGCIFARQISKKVFLDIINPCNAKLLLSSSTPTEYQLSWECQ